MAPSANRVTRRELLKLSPSLAFGAFAVPSWRDRLLQAGLSLSDTASARLFRRDHLAATFADSDVVPFDRFPYNYWDMVEPPLGEPVEAALLAVPARGH